MRLLPMLIAAVVCLSSAAAFAAEVSFDPPHVRVSGVTPSSQIAWLVVSDESKAHRRIVAETFAATSDVDGTSRIEAPSVASPDALWIAVDVASGTIVAATRGGGSVDVAFETTSPGAARQFVRKGSHTMLLLVRPGVGAWTRTAEDSGMHDADRRPDERITFSLDSLAALAGTRAQAQALRAGDFIIATDLHTLTVSGLKFR